MKFIMVQDNDCHWYVIPADKQADWDVFTALDEVDELSWIIPTYAREIGGHPSLVTFENPVIT